MQTSSTILVEMYQSTLKLLAGSESDHLYKYVVKEACKLVQADCGSLYLSRNGELHCVYSSASNIFRFPPRKRGFTYQAYKTRKPIILSREDLVTYHPEVKKSVMQSFFSIPLSYKKSSLGVLNLESRTKNYFGSSELEVLTLYGSLASLAIQQYLLYKDAHDAVNLRDRFIALASHEIRTPLTSALAYVQLIERQIEKGNAINKNMLIQTEMSLKRMTFLVNELLNVEQIRTGKLRYSMNPINFEEMVKHSIQEYKITYRDYSFDYSQAGNNVFISGDGEKIRLVISNILNNAIKFSPKHSLISLSLHAFTKYVQLIITDQGEGIRGEDKSNIFEPFYKGDQRRKDGLGIGLYLCKTIIDRHHGTISVDSKVGKGTSVIVSLPRMLQ